jgi:hypothetical protein
MELLLHLKSYYRSGQVMFGLPDLAASRATRAGKEQAIARLAV